MKFKIEDVLYLYYDHKRCGTYIVLTMERKIFVSEKVDRILAQFCLLHGSSKEGRLAFFAHTQKIARKVPLLVSEKHEIIFFPLFGKRNQEKIWIQYQPIKKISNVANINTCISFKNESVLNVSVNYRSIQRQILRCKRMIKFLHEI